METIINSLYLLSTNGKKMIELHRMAGKMKQFTKIPKSPKIKNILIESWSIFTERQSAAKNVKHGANIINIHSGFKNIVIHLFPVAYCACSVTEECITANTVRTIIVFSIAFDTLSKSLLLM